MFFLAPSKIQGLGVFAERSINRGQIIGVCHYWNGSHWDTTTLGKFYNHSQIPNTTNIQIGNLKYLVSMRPILRNEEIVVDYRFQPELEQPKSTWK